MSKVSLSMSMSLDGFIRDQMGDERLYDGEYDASDLLEELIRDTGAVLMGRNAYEMSGDPDWYADNYEYQVPIFVAFWTSSRSASCPCSLATACGCSNTWAAEGFAWRSSRSRNPARGRMSGSGS